jgi:ABC-2 type transport system permease protein
MAFLSGVFFQIEAMPEAIQTLSWLLPMRHLSAGMLDVLVRDGGVSSILAPVAVLLGFATVVTLIATRVFSWED